MVAQDVSGHMLGAQFFTSSYIDSAFWFLGNETKTVGRFIGSARRGLWEAQSIGFVTYVS